MQQQAQTSHRIALDDGDQAFCADYDLLLDAALAAGISVPFSCRRGECGSCKVRVLAGVHDSAPYLAAGRPYPLAADEMLLCQSRACSDMRIAIPGWSAAAQA